MIDKKNIEKTVADAYEKYRFCLMKDTAIFLLNKNLLEDCIQETFIIFQMKLVETDGQIDNTYAFLKKVARNVAVNYNRDSSNYYPTSKLPEIIDTGPDEERLKENMDESLKKLEEILNEMNPRARNAIIYHHGLDHSMEQTAKFIGCSKSTTQKIICRTIKTIKKNQNERSR